MSVSLDSLNPPQREAVTHVNGPMLVLAGAGSGKTRVITYRIAYLLEQGIAPEHIVAVSFTNKAAGEMRERISHMLGPTTANALVLSTFHALGARILRENAKRAKLKRPFHILDEGERRRILRSILKELNLDGSSSGAAYLLGLVSKAKNQMSSPAQMKEARFDPNIPRAQKIYEYYETALHNLNAVDFDDLLLKPTRLLIDNEDLRTRYHDKLRYFMVDEFQDTNAIQLKMLDALVNPEHHNLVVVGDDDQSIYGFRGAQSDTILNFDRMLPNAKIVTLDQNYRSVGNVLHAANAVIAHNPKRREKSLWSDLDSGHPIRSVSLETPMDEAAFVAEWIEKQSEIELRGWQDFAILYRSNNQAAAFEEILRTKRIPYHVIGGQSVFDNKEVRDLLAYLRIVRNPHDDLSLRRVINFPTRGIGTTTLQNLIEQAEQHGQSLWSALEAAIEQETLNEKTTREARLLIAAVAATRDGLDATDPAELPDRIHDFIEMIGLQRAIFAAEKNDNRASVSWRLITRLIENLERVRGNTAYDALDRWITDVSLESNNIQLNDKKDETQAVTLMTVHGSKGLEFPIVFLVGMNEMLLPHRRALEEPRGVEEERRLCYVGMTRAKERLVLTRARWQTSGEREKTRLLPSRFLKEIPEELLEDRTITGQGHFMTPNKERQLERLQLLRKSLES